MTMPTAILLAVMSLFPLLFTLYYSFTDYYYLSKDGAQWSGLANFIRLVKDAYFRQAVWNTVKFTVICTIVETSLGLAIAIFVHGMRRGKKAMRTLLLLPYLLPSVTVALIWQIMLSGNYGIINGLLKTLGLPVFNWFFDVKTAFGTIVFIDIWQSTPFVFLLMYATLQGVPESQYEAARLDGAGKWKQFLHITLPSIKGGLFICLLLRTIDTFRLFEKVNILTKGGPSNTTATITQYLYLNGIRSLKFGFGSAMAVVMTVLVFALSALYIRKALSSEK
jgi:multiple sugar transport system permease protein